MSRTPPPLRPINVTWKIEKNAKGRTWDILVWWRGGGIRELRFFSCLAGGAKGCWDHFWWWLYPLCLPCFDLEVYMHKISHFASVRFKSKGITWMSPSIVNLISYRQDKGISNPYFFQLYKRHGWRYSVTLKAVLNVFFITNYFSEVFEFVSNWIYIQIWKYIVHIT